MEATFLVKLAEIKSTLSRLQKIDFNKGWEELYYQISFLERAIDRIYPEKDAIKIKIKLHSTPNMPNDFMLKKEIAYKEKIKRANNIIKLIEEEYTYFGFDDFKPIKEKVETEFGINQGKPSWFRRKTKE